MEYTTEEAAARDKKTAQERARLQIAESDIRGAIERIRFFEGQDGQGHFTAAREYLEMALTEIQKGKASR